MATWKPIEDAAKIHHIKAQVFKLWRLPLKAASPCPLPVSMSPADLPTLRQKPYLVAPKHDGVRYLLLLTQYPAGVNVAVLVARNWRCYPITVAARASFFRAASLFDGELVREPIAHADCTAPWRLMYRVFDVIGAAGEVYAHWDYNRRHAVLRTLFFEREDVDTEALYDPKAWHNVTAPTVARQAGKLVAAGNAHYLGFRCKAWRPLADIQGALREMHDTVADGLIFMPVDEGVCRTRRHTRMFKWKTRHTIDLKATLGEDGVVQCSYYDGATKRDVAGALQGNGATPVYTIRVIGDTSGLVGRGEVCEFEIVDVSDDVVWVQYVAARADKVNANEGGVVAATIDNYVHPVTEDMLVMTCMQ